MPQDFSQEEIHLRDYLRVILKRRWLILSVFIILVATVIIGSFIAEPIYQATAQILIERENPNVVNIQEVLGVNATDQNYYQTQYEILKSKSLVLKVIHALNLKESPEFVSEKKSFSLKVLFSFPGKKEEKTSDKEDNRLVEAYLGRLQVDPIRNSRLLDVSFEGKDPEIVTQITNTHAKLYIESGLERRFSASGEAVSWLGKRVEMIKKKLGKSEALLQDYRKKEDLVSIDFNENYNINIRKLNDLNSALTVARMEKIEKESLYLELKKISDGHRGIESIPAVVSNLLIQQLKGQYVKLSGEYYELSQKYGPEHPKMIRLSSQIKEIKGKISQEIGKIAESIETEYRVALTKEKSILSALEEQKREALELNQKQIKYDVLKREVESNRSLYKSLLKRVKEAGVTEGLKASNIMIVDPARVLDKPVKPRILLNILLAIISGLTLGVGLAFFFEYLDNTIKSPEEVEKYLNIPLLGVVGRFEGDAANPEKGELPSLTSPRSIISESFRTIRTNLLFTSPDNRKRLLLVSSADIEEGKTILSGNLAVVFARMKKRVLLVDADLRRPRIHNIFNLERSPGLSELLAGNQDFSSIINDTEIDDLKVITCGTIPPNPTELLASEAMKNLIKKLGDSFDIVIFDSPPVLSGADSLELAALLDGVVMATKAGSTPKPAVKRAIQHLSEVGGKILGCVLNDVDFEKEAYHYSHYQHYYKYYYGEEEKKEAQAEGQKPKTGRIG